MGRRKAEEGEVDLLAGVERSAMPALLAHAKANGNEALIAAILEACSE